jgi:hypothetical protein
MLQVLLFNHVTLVSQSKIKHSGLKILLFNWKLIFV